MREIVEMLQQCVEFGVFMVLEDLVYQQLDHLFFKQHIHIVSLLSKSIEKIGHEFF